MGFTRDTTAMINESVERFKTKVLLEKGNVDIISGLVVPLSGAVEDKREEYKLSRKGRAYKQMIYNMGREFEDVFELMARLRGAGILNIFDISSFYLRI